MLPERKLQFGDFEFDLYQRLLVRDGRVVSLSPKVLRTLELLLEADGGVVSKEVFMHALWPDTFVEESNLTQNIFILRKTLGVTATGDHYLATLPKRGYRLTVAVVSMQDAAVSEVPAADVKENTAQMDTAAVGQDGVELPAPVQRLKLDEVIAVQPSASGEHSVAPDAMREVERHVKRSFVPSALWPWAIAALLLLILLTRRTLFHARQTSGPPLIVRTRRLTNDGLPKSLGPFPTTLVTDGERLFFTERRDNQSVIAEVPLNGGQVTTHEAPYPDSTVADYSRSGRHLLLGSIWHTDDTQPILTQRPAGSTGAAFQQVGELTGHEASWSPVGDRIAVAHGRFLQVADADGRNLTSLVSAMGVIYWPRWSPDGKLLRFTENFSANLSEIWEVAADGAGLHQILAGTAEGEQACCGSWSADGRSYVYLVAGPARSSIWMLPEQETGEQDQKAPVQLTVGTDEEWHAPLISADRTHVWAIASQQRGELMRVDPQTRELRPYLQGMSAEGVAYSPDRAWIAYTAYPEGTLWRSHPDGTSRIQLTQSPQVARFPRWSPDGSTLAYVGGQAGSAWKLYLLDVASARVTPMLQDDTNQGVASWSPDGKQIAFGRLLNFGTKDDPNLTIEILNRSSGKRTVVHGSAGLWTPRWSPDGRFISAVTQDNRSLRLFNLQRQQWTVLADIGVNDVVWSPDSRSLYFDTVFGGAPMLYRVQIAEGKVEPWADLKGLNRGGYFSPWLGMAPDGAPLLLRDTAIEEIYELSLKSSR